MVNFATALQGEKRDHTGIVTDILQMISDRGETDQVPKELKKKHTVQIEKVRVDRGEDGEGDTSE